MVAWSGLQQWWKTYYCKRLKEVLEGPAATSVLTSGHVLLTCGIGAVLLIAQLLLQQWPSNFFGFCMLSPLLAAVMLGGACLAAFPGSFGSLAVVLGVATLGLTAWQSVLGGIFHQLPLGDSRALFTLGQHPRPDGRHLPGLQGQRAPPPAQGITEDRRGPRPRGAGRVRGRRDADRALRVRVGRRRGGPPAPRVKKCVLSFTKSMANQMQPGDVMGVGLDTQAIKDGEYAAAYYAGDPKINANVPWPVPRAEISTR